VDVEEREITSFTLPIGTHENVLTVVDTGGYVGTDSATVVVNRFGSPDIASLTSTSGSITVGDIVTIPADLALPTQSMRQLSILVSCFTNTVCHRNDPDPTEPCRVPFRSTLLKIQKVREIR
jgi:hypothetical protein